MKRSILFSILGAVVAGDLVAQACTLGPGEVYGVTAYQCANCGFKRENPERLTYIFYAEPVITDAKSPGLFRIGDVIEAVDKQPITTTAGAELFTYPTAGSHEISVRRGRVRQQLRFVISGSGCETRSAAVNQTRFQLRAEDIESIEVIRGPAAERYNIPVPNAGAIVITTRNGALAPRTGAARDSMASALREMLPSPKPGYGPEPIIIVDGVQIEPAEARAMGIPFDRTGRFGFAVGCERACTARTGRDGALTYTYYVYSESPSIMGVRPGGAADRAGIRAGDVVTKVDGVPLSDDEGGKKLARLERVDHARVTVRRDGREIEFVLQADR